MTYCEREEEGRKLSCSVGVKANNVYHSRYPISVVCSPTELATKIIAIIEDGHHSKHHQRGQSPLADIALVSHTWNAVCRLHMFNTVTLYSDTVHSRLSFIHFQAPHLSQYIRELYFQPSAAERIASKAEWFPACFAQFDNLDKIRFENCCKGPLPAASLAAFAAP
ncbi:hypothetical protein PC9H_010085 [Pleurotus ostreatus]|uniref:Uncharacterized protein n=1 Tax=Pleurotus ostreatus TaxID=5322 RepID=A0A8H6ZQV6_PLEOS|nr:uncharacterized protein PC9H_010085 [Pleurotus ostreatus]KAF7424774.1 hypothetical protein PC9H_010085 [Pleurotus ostreatus]